MGQYVCMSRRVRFHGIAHFPWDIPVGPETLGMVERIKLGSNVCMIALPVASSGMAGTQLLAPLDYRGKPLAQPLLSSSAGQWGYTASATLCYLSAARISFLLNPTANVAASAEFKDLGDAFLKWFEVIREWAAAWSHQPLRTIGEPRGSVLYVPTGGGLMAGSGARAGSVFVGAAPLTDTQLRGAFRCASRDEHLPVEHRLLLSAQVAHMGGDFRLAVIDAGSAAEVGLATAISDELRLKGVDSEFIERALVDANGVVGLAALYAALGRTLPVSKNRVASELAQIRNTAAHGGRIPTEAEAERALQHSRALVQAARPLPPL